MINSVIRYFDLQSETRDQPLQHGKEAGPLRIPVYLQYVATVFGIVAEPYLHRYMETASFDVTWDALWRRVVFGVLMGIAILPAAYKSTFDDDRPTLVQLATLFVAGLGWQSLFTAGATAVTGVPG